MSRGISYSRIVAAGFVLGGGVFGLLRGTNAEPLPVPPPISVAEPRPDPNSLPLQPVGSFPIPSLPTASVPPNGPLPTVPGLPVPMLPTPAPVPSLPTPSLPAPEAPKFPEITQPPQFPTPTLPMMPAFPMNPENTLRPTPAPLNLIPTEPATPTRLAPEAFPVSNPKPLSIPDKITPIAPYTPGETPMLSISKTTFSTVLGVALALAPTTAIHAEEPKIPLTLTAEETLKKEIKDLKDELKKTKDLLSALDENVLGRKDGKVTVAADAGLLQRVDKLEKALTGIEAKVKSLDETLAKRVVASSPLEVTKPAAGMGKVKVVNEFATKMSIVVNDVSYQLEANQTKEVEVAKGSFAYRLVSDGAVKTTSDIKEGETVTLRIRSGGN